MRRFDIAIKSLTEELYKRAGKAAIEFATTGCAPIGMASEINAVKNIKEAIAILANHERNKNI